MKRIKKSATPPVAPKAHAVAEARPAPIIRHDLFYSRLRVGDVIKLNGCEFVVDYINECRARCIPLSRKRVSYKTAEGKQVDFTTDHAGQNISPNSEGKILKRLGPDWRKTI
jgi:hypothetical protein